MIFHKRTILSLTCNALSKPKVEETWLESEYKRYKKKRNDKSNYTGANWQGREKALCFSVTMFGDDVLWRFSVMNHEKSPILWRARSLTSCLFAGCPCQMGVVDWKFDRHPYMLLITSVAEVFRDMYKIRAWVFIRFRFQTELVS